MKTPTKRNMRIYGALPMEHAHGIESRSTSRLSKSTNPFSKSNYGEDDGFRPSGVSSSELLTSPTCRQKRSFQRDVGISNSTSITKRFRIRHSTPLFNGCQNGVVTLSGGEATWKQRSSLLMKMNEHQQKADTTILNISVLLREVDRCNALLRELCLSR